MTTVTFDRNMNEYVEIVDYYDNLLTSGYYDFDTLGKNLHDLLENKKKILDIGIGTGLLAEKMLQLGDYEITGVDFSSAMLKIAEERLSDSDVKLICEDILTFQTNDKFDAIISSGGAIYMVAEKDEYRLYSHIVEKNKNKQLIEKLYGCLAENGFFALAIQGPHKNYRQKIKEGIYYEQRIDKHDSYVDKWYTFSDTDGSILTEQFCKFYFFDGSETKNIFNKIGCDQIKVVGDKFWVACPSG